MLPKRTTGALLLGIGSMIAVSVGIFLFLQRKPAAGTHVSADTLSTPPPPAPDTIPAPRSNSQLADGTQVYLIGDSKLEPHRNFPAQREITLDGDAFFEVPAAATDMTVRSKQLLLTVKGKAAFRLNSPSAEVWAELDVLEGTVIVRKAYASQFSEPDTLHGGNMQMLNRDIDLMEKETFDTVPLRAWRGKLPH